jgi:hypothetical protein
MINVSSLAETLNVEEAELFQILEEHGDSDEQSGPWYVHAILAIGAWIAGGALIGFAIALCLSAFHLSEPGVALGLIGLFFFAIGLKLLWGDAGGNGIFTAQFAVTLSIAGTALIAGGLGIETRSFWWAANLAAFLAVFIAWKVPGLMLQFLASTLAISLVLATLVVNEASYIQTMVSLLLGAGLALLLYPPLIDFRPTAISMLFVPSIAIALFDAIEYGQVKRGYEWIPHAIMMALLCWLVWTIWHYLKGQAAHLELVVFAIFGVAACAILPIGGSAALLIIVLAYALGSRLLAIAGVLLEAYFLIHFYYSLEFLLLEKAIMLVAVGAILLACWAITGRKAKRWVLA